MYSLDEFYKSLCKIAPIELSQKYIADGGYDNSGILIRCKDTVSKVLFSLDLSLKAVEKAKRIGADTIVTHHPAIYNPLKSLSVGDPVSASVLKAIENGINVISMHINLDLADGGIDACLCKGLGGENYKILEYLDGSHGYGREFTVEKIELSKYVLKIKKEFKTHRVIYYGKKRAVIKKVASFCGSGPENAYNNIVKGSTDADVIVTADMPHHLIKAITEAGKNIILLTHYACENYGFKEFYERIFKTCKDLSVAYFEDRSFM